MAERYIFPAVFYPPGQEGLDICVVFPDLGEATQGTDLANALDMAKELLELTLYGLEEEGLPIPAASDAAHIELDQQGAFVAPISVYMPVVRAEMASQYVRKTVTLPKWLNDVAESAGINFSRSLQTAIRLILDVSPPPGTVEDFQKLLKENGCYVKSTKEYVRVRQPRPTAAGQVEENPRPRRSRSRKA